MEQIARSDSDFCGRFGTNSHKNIRQKKEPTFDDSLINFIIFLILSKPQLHQQFLKFR